MKEILDLNYEPDYFGARYYNPALGRWMNPDPLAGLSPELTPYHYVRNNPLVYIEPDGLREFNCTGWNEFKIDLVIQGGETGNWCTSDRRANSETWQTANEYNLENNRPGEYWTIAQRADFYKWYSQSVHGMGHQIWWPAAAAFVSSQMAFAVRFRLVGLLPFVPGGVLTSESIVRFMNAGNKQVFDGVFGNLADVYFGRVSPGAGWDRDILEREQWMLQPLYEEQNFLVIRFLKSAAKNPVGPYPLAQIPFRGNIMIPDDRVAHGMNVADMLRKNPGMYYALLRLKFR